MEWTPEREGLILLRIAEGKTREEIATELVRSTRVIGWRINTMIVRLFQKGCSCAELAVLFRICIEDVENALRPSINPSLQTACSNPRSS